MKSENKSQKSEKPFKKSRLSKPLALLNTFSQEELNNFQELIKCDYLTNKNISYLLLNSLQKFALTNCEKFKSRLLLNRLKDSTSKKKEMEKIELQFEKLIEELKQGKFPGEIQNVVCIDVFKKDKTTGDTQSKEFNKELNKLMVFAETFLKFEAIRTTDEYDVELLLPELRKRNQMSLYDKHIKALEKTSKEEGREADYHKQRYKIEVEKNRLLCFNNKIGKEDNYDELQKHLDTKYLLEKLQYHLAKISLLGSYAGKVYNLKPFNALKAIFNLHEYKSDTFIKLYTLNIHLIETGNKGVFDKLLKLLEKEQDKIHKDFLNPFYTNLANYCVDQLIKGDLQYYNYMFEIYFQMDKADLIVINKIIDIDLLKNIITIACRVNNFDWAYERLEYYKIFILKEKQNSVYKYNCGIISFNKKEYDIALTHFREVEKINFTYDLNLRIVRLECYYEIYIEHSIETEVEIKSLKAYIKSRRKLTKDQKMAYLNFILIFNKLYNLKKIECESTFKDTLLELKKQFYEFKFIREKSWLENKLTAFEESF